MIYKKVEKIEEKIYPMNGIKVDKGYYSVFELKRKYDAEERRVILDSDFQREDIWRRENKAELVESVLMGLPLPIFYFNQDFPVIYDIWPIIKEVQEKSVKKDEAA